MNCQEALSLLYDIIDKEASEIDVKEVTEHLRNCRDCSGVYRLERSVNELVQEKLSNQRVTPRLDSLKAKVLSELDQIDCDNRPAQASPEKKSANVSPRPAFRLGWAIALAASLVIVVGAYFVGRSIFDKHSAFLPLEQSHWAAVEHANSYSDMTTTTLARAATQQALAYDVAESIGSFQLVGGQAETIDNVPLVHFVYHNADRYVSVFVIDASRFTLPDDLIATLVHRNGVDFYDHNCRGCRLVYRRAGNALVVTATSHRDLELLDFVPDRNPV